MQELSPVKEDLRTLLKDRDHLVILYVGNLEVYQGIDLLLNSFRLSVEESIPADLFIIGGEPADMKKYRGLSKQLGIALRTHFLGPRSVKSLSHYLSQADILVSPRITGKNTPMKIYSYLGSGKAVIATSLEMHTQVLDDSLAILVEPEPDAFAQGLLKLSQNQPLRQALGYAGKQLISKNFSLESFTQQANGLLDWVQTTLSKDDQKVAKI